MDQDSDTTDRAEFKPQTWHKLICLEKKNRSTNEHLHFPAPFSSRKSQDERFNHTRSAVHSSGDFLTFSRD